MNFSLILPPSFSVSRRMVSPLTLLCSQLAMAGCHDLIEQNAPIFFHTAAGAAFTSMSCLTSAAIAAEARPPAARPAATAISLTTRILSFSTQDLRPVGALKCGAPYQAGGGLAKS